MITHQWGGAPGTYCTKCFNESPLEDAINCPDCKWSGGEYDMIVHEPCEMHHEWEEVLSTGCPPEKDKVAAFKTKWGF